MNNKEDFKKLTQWFDVNWEEGNMCPPPMDTDTFEKYLVYYLLPRPNYISLSISEPQARSQVLHSILMHHSKEYQEEYEKHRKNLKKYETDKA